MYEKTLAQLSGGRLALGRFTLPELEEGDEAIGTLTWSAEDGAELILLDPGPEWPLNDLNDSDDVYGLLSDNTLVTLPRAAVRGYTQSAMREVKVRGMTLLIGANVEPSEVWDRVRFRTAHLHEWLERTGLETQEREHDEAHQVTGVSVRWRPPKAVCVSRTDGALTLSVGLSASADHGPEQEFMTRLNVRSKPNEPCEIDELERRYTRPLVVFSTIVADRWDAASDVLVSGPSSRLPIQVLRAGWPATQREWQPGDGAYLFRADDCDDVEEVLDRWFDLYSDAGLPIAVFAETLRSGNSYFPGRLIQSVSALEGYCDARLGGSERKILDTLKALRDHAEIDPAINGCSDRHLELLAQARNYYTHLGTRKGYTAEELEASLLSCCRWAGALMQSCILRGLGFSGKRSAELLSGHYRRWPLP